MQRETGKRRETVSLQVGRVPNTKAVHRAISVLVDRLDWGVQTAMAIVGGGPRLTTVAGDTAQLGVRHSTERRSLKGYRWVSGL